MYPLRQLAVPGGLRDREGPAPNRKSLVQARHCLEESMLDLHEDEKFIDIDDLRLSVF